MNKLTNNRIITAMSGGVDSSVTALLLKQQGFDVHGLFMKNWEEDDTDDYCSATEDVTDAQAVCDVIGIPLHTINFSAEYWDNVFEYFLAEYRAGRTPNPDILCNKEIKFKAFLDYTKELGGELMATGHYARKIEDENGQHLLKALDANKDQSYFLYQLDQYQLSQAIFPLGELTKPQVRDIAKQAGLANHKKKDSTGICFIGERKFKTFLSDYLPHQPGDIETEEGKVIGQHDGLMYHTIGQRKGLNIGGRKDCPEAAWYVLAKDMKRNVLLVGQGHDHPHLYSTTLTAEQMHWIAGQAPNLPLTCHAKIRYRQDDQACHLEKLSNDRYHVTFDVPQWAIAPGQSVVFYQHDQCLGGGIIN